MARRGQWKWREQAREDYQFYAGDQWTDEDKARLETNLRPVVVFNRLAPIVDAVSGQEVVNRQAVRYIPRQMGEVQVNEVLTAASDWIRDECDAEHEESDAFLDAAICGVGWLGIRLSYDRDLDGQILIERIDPLEMWVDPASQRKNFMDAKWIIRERLVDRSEAERLWPGREFEEKNGPSEPLTVDIIDAAYYRQNSGMEDRRPGEKGKCVILEYQWMCPEPVWRVPGAALGRPDPGLVAMDEKEWNSVKSTLPPETQVIEQTRMRCRRAFVSGETLLEEGLNADPDHFTYLAITAKRDRHHKYWYGIVRGMKDPQRWANRFFSQILEILQSNAKGGLIAETDAFSDPRQAENDWGRPDTIIWANPGAIAANKIQPRQFLAFPQSFPAMLQFAVESIPDVAGINQSVMGQTPNTQVPGMLENIRRQAGIYMLSYLFDGLRRYRIECGRVLLEMIRRYIPQGVLVKVVDKGDAQYVPLATQPETVKYDVVVDEAPSSPNVKERTWGVLQTLFPVLSELHVPPAVWMSLLQYSPLPESLLESLQQSFSPSSPQAQQQQAQEQQRQAQAQQLQVQMAQSQIQKNLAQAQSLRAKAQTDQQRQAIDLKIAELELEKSRLEATAESARAASKIHESARQVLNDVNPNST